VIQVGSNSGLGYAVLLMLQLYSVSPLLPLVPIVALGIVIHFLVLSNKNSAMLERRRLEESTEPLAEPMAEKDPPLQLPTVDTETRRWRRRRRRTGLVRGGRREGAPDRVGRG
jgi:hypothetical protein